MASQVNRREEDRAELRRSIDGIISIFWRRWNIPCVHILRADRLWEVISERQWEDWASKWHAHGFSQYERTSPKPADEANSAGETKEDKLEFREVVDTLQTTSIRCGAQ